MHFLNKIIIVAACTYAPLLHSSDKENLFETTVSSANTSPKQNFESLDDYECNSPLIDKMIQFDQNNNDFVDNEAELPFLQLPAPILKSKL